MSYDPEKYREKREKVLGIQKRGMGFLTLSLITAFLIMSGLGMSTIPKALSYINTRNLDDAIFKLETENSALETILAQISEESGVKTVSLDKNGQRVVVTYDRRKTSAPKIKSIFDRSALSTTLLNEVNHRQHETTLQKERKEIEAP